MKLSKVYGQLRERSATMLRAIAGESLFEKIADGPRPELGQATLRLVIATAVLGYVVWYVLRDGAIQPDERLALLAATAFVLFAAGLVAQIVVRPQKSVARRLLGIVIDNAVASYGLYVLGEGGAIILGLYLFVTVGNNFRYGQRYMYASQALAVTGFLTVVKVSPFWSQHLSIAVGELVALVIVPIYVGHLGSKVTKERKRADEANQAKGRFLANVSHEMRTPLNGVIAMADVLRETRLNESQKEIVDTLATSAHLLLVQIEDVLDMAKIEAGRVQLESKPFDLGRLLAGTVKVVMPQARYKGLSVTTELAENTARWYLGDPHHTRQVLLNLLANAVKFTDHGSVTLQVRTVSSDELSARIRFEVRDTGIGIAPEHQSRIFEPFSQADNSIGRIYGGTGLGTTIARQLIIQMGGEIGLTSELGVGSKFWFELPLQFCEPAGVDLTAEVADEARLSTTAAAITGQHPGNVTKIKGARVLVAEDNPTNQRVTQMILESGGHRPTIVDNGEAALDALERGSFDLALFDLAMPIVSGLEALKLYRYATQHPIPILILSANVTTEIIDECQRAGCAEFVPKPVRASMLLGAIERHLSVAVEIAQPAPRPRAEERPNLTIIDTPIVDLQVLADLGRLSPDPTFVERLIRGFHSDTDRLVKEICDSLAARKYEAAKNSAHALKGGAGSVGATQLVQFAIRLEKASHDVIRLKTSAWTEELVRAAGQAREALDQHLEERRRQQGGA